MLGHKAQAGVMVLGPELWRIRTAQATVEASGFRLSNSYLSIAEISEYAESLLLSAAFGLGFVAGPALGALSALRGSRLSFFVAAGITGSKFGACSKLPADWPGSSGPPSAASCSSTWASGRPWPRVRRSS